MSESDIINDILNIFFNNNFVSKYTVIKINPKFPLISFNSDLDILVHNIKLFKNELDLRSKKSNKIFIRFKSLNYYHAHYDIFDIDTKILILRFDLYSTLPKYNVINLKNNLFFDVISCSSLKKIKLTNSIIFVSLPDNLFDLTFRYIEYYEFFWTGSKKDHHIEFIKKAFLNDPTILKSFLNHIHHYVEIPTNFHSKYSTLIQIYKNRLKFKYYIKKFLSRFLNINL